MRRSASSPSLHTTPTTCWSARFSLTIRSPPCAAPATGSPEGLLSAWPNPAPLAARRAYDVETESSADPRCASVRDGSTGPRHVERGGKTHGVLIRPARPDECELLSELALRSKGCWGYDAEFLEACRAELTLVPED
jgi:hypothetical protein